MKFKVIAQKQSRLYVIHENGGYSTLGVDVCENRTRKLAAELSALGHPVGKARRVGTLAAYKRYQDLCEIAREEHNRTGWQSASELTPELIGLEHRRVEVSHRFTSPNGSEGTRRSRFWVGKSTGWIPCHLAIARSNCHGGPAVCLGEIISVRVLS